MANSARQAARKNYWRRNLRLMVILLLVWFACSFGAGIIFRDQLDSLFSIGGAPFGFWMAQQGSILIFMALIFIYHIVMSRAEETYKTEIEGRDKSDEGARS